MLLGEVREEIVQVCRRLSAAGLMPGTSGNVSVRAGDLVAMTPTGVDYAELTAGQVGVHGLDGAPVEAPLRPTSELPLHLAVYAAKDPGQASAIVHTHPTAAIALSTLVDELPPIHYMIALFEGPVLVAPYATYGTSELAANTVEALRTSHGCILANHGTVTIGPDLSTACTRNEYLEWLSELYLRAASAGRPRLLDADEIARVGARLSGYGQAPPR